MIKFRCVRSSMAHLHSTYRNCNLPLSLKIVDFVSKIDDRGAVAHYNLASVHSINKKIHPALGEIDAALAKGFIRFRSEVKHLAA